MKGGKKKPPRELVTGKAIELSVAKSVLWLSCHEDAEGVADDEEGRSDGESDGDQVAGVSWMGKHVHIRPRRVRILDGLGGYMLSASILMTAFTSGQIGWDPGQTKVQKD